MANPTTSAPFSCPHCADVFTRRENLDRHQRSRHPSGPEEERPHACERCDASFSRRDVLKRHVQRCARGLHTRKQRRKNPTVSGLTTPENDGQTGSAAASTSARQDVADDIDDMAHVDMVNNDFINAVPDTEQMPGQVISALTFGPATLARHGVAPWIASSYAQQYFTHFQPFLPIIHRPTFSLSAGHDLLSSIVVAIGSVYAPSRDVASAKRASDQIWSDGLKDLEDYLQDNSIMFREPWTLQACLLHVVYGFYFAESNTSGACWNLLQSLVRDLRSLCLMNQHLTLFANTAELWTSTIPRSAAWSSVELDQAWETFALQESFRMCIWALGLISQHIAATCNTRTLVPATELSWDMPPSRRLWEAPSANDWLIAVQEQIQRGHISLPGTMNSAGEVNTVAHVTQALMNGSPPSHILSRLIACPFAAICILSNIETLIRDFTYVYYQMPPVLPDPSAYHALAPEQNRPINAAITALLSILDKLEAGNDQIHRLLRLSCWNARLGLCEPDDLLLSGIVDNSLTAGLATSAHLILGTTVATRRAVTSRRRRFGEDASMTAWDDLLKALAEIISSCEDHATRPAPWMTTLGFRILLLLWRTLRRAITEMELKSASGSPKQDISPASVMSSLVFEKTRQHFAHRPGLPGFEDPRAFEAAFLLQMADTFASTLTPVGQATSGILREVGDILAASTTGMGSC